MKREKYRIKEIITVKQLKVYEKIFGNENTQNYRRPLTGTTTHSRRITCPLSELTAIHADIGHHVTNNQHTTINIIHILVDDRTVL